MRRAKSRGYQMRKPTAARGLAATRIVCSGRCDDDHDGPEKVAANLLGRIVARAFADYCILRRAGVISEAGTIINDEQWPMRENGNRWHGGGVRNAAQARELMAFCRAEKSQSPAVRVSRLLGARVDQGDVDQALNRLYDSWLATGELPTEEAVEA